jgi:hypothetical protein
MSAKQKSIDLQLKIAACLLFSVYYLLRLYFNHYINVVPRPSHHFPVACLLALVSGIVVKFGFSGFFQRNKSRATWIIANIFGIVMIAGYIIEVHA